MGEKWEKWQKRLFAVFAIFLPLPQAWIFKNAKNDDFFDHFGTSKVVKKNVIFDHFFRTMNESKPKKCIFAFLTFLTPVLHKIAPSVFSFTNLKTVKNGQKWPKMAIFAVFDGRRSRSSRKCLSFAL